MEVTKIGISGEPEFIEDINVLPFMKEAMSKHKKEYINAFATFIHFMFKKDLPYWVYPEVERIKIIDEEVLKDIKSEAFLTDPNCFTLYNRIKNSVMSESEKLYERTKVALSDLAEKIRNIPIEKKGYYDQEIIGQNGMVTKVKCEVMIDNSTEYLKSLKTAEDILDHQERLRKRIEEEKKKERRQKKDITIRLFEE